MIGTSAVALITVLLVNSASAQDADKDKFKETFSARAIAMGNVAFGASTTVHITINRWTTDEERRHLIETLVEKESEDLLKALQKQKETGFMRITGSGAGRTRYPSVRLHYAREFRGEGKRVIRLATDRPIGFWEAVQNPCSMDYTFTLIELSLDEKTEEGDGTLAVGVEIKLDKEKKLVLEHAGTKPARLTHVKKRK